MSSVIDRLKSYDWDRRKSEAEGLLKSNDWRERGASIRVLGESANKDAIPLLLDSLKDEDRGVSKEAAKALIRLREVFEKSDFALLVRKLWSENNNERESSVHVLKELVKQMKGFPKFTVITMLTEALNDPRPDVRLSAIKTLYETDVPKAEDSIIAMLGDGSEARPSVVPMLKKFNSEKSKLFLNAFYYNKNVPPGLFSRHVSLVERLAVSSYVMVRFKAMNILSELDEHKWLVAIRAAAVANNTEVRMFAVDSLIAKGNRESGKILKMVAETDESEAGNTARNYLLHRKKMYAVKKALVEGDPEERVDAVETLLEMQHPEAQDILNELAESDKSEAGNAARAALKELKDREIDDFF